MGALLSVEPSIRIGNGVSFSKNCHVGAVGEITIQDNVVFGSNVLINDHAHGLSYESSVPRARQPLVTKGGIEIGENCWIGDNVCILSGAKIGKNCIVGANSVVNKPFEGDGLILAGAPARVVKKMERNKDE